MVLSEKIEGVDIISFNIDRINALNVEKIRPDLLRLFDLPYTKAVIDLAGVHYLDSTGFAMFLHLLRVARSNYGIFRLCGLTPRAKELFELLQLHSAIDIYPDRKSCIDSYLRNGPS
jgi:anti-sigma B factor antagonist